MAKRKKKKHKFKDKIDPNTLPTRDELFVKLKCGATKAGVHKDRKKDADKKACRKKVRHDDE